MRSNRVWGLVTAILASTVVAAGLAQPCAGQLRINEILADPGVDWDGDGSVDSKYDEWVEIVNSGSTPAALDDYRLSDGVTRNLRFGFSGTLPPGGVKVVYGSDSSAWEVANGLTNAGLSLNNSGDTVNLWHVSGADTLLADTYTYASFEVLDDRSTARAPDGGTTWRLFDALNPYVGTVPPLGTGCPPTPGGSNQCPTAVEPWAWSAVKRLYGPTAEQR
jgi:hypothetical protein